MGDTADDVLRSFKLSEEDAKNYKTVVGKFEQHFVRRRNVIYERARFNQRRQEPGESANTFITALFTLAEHCGYAAMHDEMIRDRIVVGLRDARLSEKMQLEADLTLEKAITQARQAESIKQQQLFVRGTAEGPSPRQPEKDVGVVSKGRRSPRIASDKKHPKLIRVKPLPVGCVGNPLPIQRGCVLQRMPLAINVVSVAIFSQSVDQPRCWSSILIALQRR